MNNFATELFGINISVKKDYRDRLDQDFLQWKDLTFELMMKYMWYFEYRQALLKVKYPRLKVEMNQYRYQPETLTAKEIVKKKLNNRFVAKKRKITELENKLSRARSNWTECSPLKNTHCSAKSLRSVSA